VGRVVEGTGGQRSSAGAGELETTNAMLRSVIDGIADPVFAVGLAVADDGRGFDPGPPLSTGGPPWWSPGPPRARPEGRPA
jgi:hypothetical protein